MTVFHRLWDTLVRWRTWIANILFGIIITPDLILAMLGYNWAEVIPARYMPLVTVAIIALNVWMRPRPAVRAQDVEAGK